MKFALVNGPRQTAQPGLRGTCPECEQPVIARCGENRVDHWAHKVRSNCNNRWETEGPWHRNWKGQFSDDWQEITQYAEDGERHIADVKTAHGYVIEFQHSYIKPEERRSREAFYPKLVWVVNGTRRERDAPRFSKAWERGTALRASSSKRCVSSDGGALLRDWAGSRAHVFFDFGNAQWLWWLSPESNRTRWYVQHIPRAKFVEIHRQTSTQTAREFDKLAHNFHLFIASHEGRPAQPLTPPLSHPAAPTRMIRRRFRL